MHENQLFLTLFLRKSWFSCQNLKINTIFAPIKPIYYKVWERFK